MANNIKDKLIQTLVSDFTISDSLLPTNSIDQLDSDKLFKVLTSAYELGYDDSNNILFYITDDGEKYICPDLSYGLSTSSEQVSDVLPTPNFDIDQGESVRKSSEVRSLYTIVCLLLFFSELSDEIKQFVDNYDFNNFSSDIQMFSDYPSATSFLKSFTDLNSLQINCVVSAAAIVLTQTQEKKGALWKSQLTREETLGLSKISRDVKGIIIKFEKEDKINPIDVGLLTKIQKLTAIKRRDLAIEEVINASPLATLYRITKFNSERLSPIAKRKILKVSKRIAEVEIETANVTDKLVANELYDKTFYEMQRVLTRKAVPTLIDFEIKKYKVDPTSYVFVKKIQSLRIAPLGIN